MNEQKTGQSGTQENKPNQNQRTIAEQILISFDAAQKVLIDMKVRSIIIDNPNLLEVLAFFEDAYRVGNFVSGKFILQSQEKFNLEVEMNKLKETIKQKDSEIQALVLQQPTRTP